MQGQTFIQLHYFRSLLNHYAEVNSHHKYFTNATAVVQHAEKHTHPAEIHQGKY